MFRALILVGALLMAGVPRDALGQDPPAGYEEGLFELIIQRTDTRLTLRTLVAPTGEVLLPLSPVLIGTGIPAVDTGDTVVLEWPPDTWRTTIDRVRRTLTMGTRTDSLRTAHWLFVNGETWVSASALASLLQTEVQVSFENLVVTVAENRDFPVIRRARIETQRAWTSAARRAIRDSTPYPARTGGLAASWGVSLLEANGQTHGSARAATGAALLGGSIETGATLAFGDAESARVDDAYARWARGFPHNPWLRQLQLGHVFGDGPAGRRILGISVTNAPLTTPRFFDDALIQPTVPAGWEYEVYQGDYLVGVGNRESTAGISTTLDYGNTPVRVRMIGPAGQEMTQELIFVVRPGMVPAGEWRHAAGAGACVDEGCRDYAYAELRHGVSSRFSAGLGIDRLTPDSLPSEWRPYAFAGGNPLRNLSFELHAQPDALVRSDALLQGAKGRSVSASYAWFRTPGSQIAGWSAQVAGTGPALGRSLNARFLLRGTENGTVDFWQASASAAFRAIYSTLEYESGLQNRDLITARTYAVLPRSRVPLDDAALSVSLGASSAGAELFETGFTFRPHPATIATISTRFRRGSEPALTLGFVTRFSAAFTRTRASHGPTGNSIFLSADGGVATGARNGIELLPFESIGRAGISGFVFLDLDGDGQFGAGDEPAPGVDVLIGSSRVTTDDAGAFRAWHAEPYEPITVAIDSLSTPDISWLPEPTRVRVRPSPNLFTRVDLPLVRTREVSGRVASNEQFPTVGGIAIVIHHADGSVATETRTYSDGVFYIPRLRAGRYTATVAPSSLAVLGAIEPTPIEFVIDSRQPSLTLPPFELRPRG